MILDHRSTEVAGPANQREEFRKGFLVFYDRFWELVNLRNDNQDGLFMLDVPTFSGGAVREAILDAAAHREYRHPGSVFVRQFPRRIEIVSPDEGRVQLNGSRRWARWGVAKDKNGADGV